MDISTSLLYFYAVLVLSARGHVASPCNDEKPCQQGFICSTDFLCKPTDNRLTLFPKPELERKDFQKSLRITRKVKPLDEDREMLIMLGNEGAVDEDHKKPVHNKGEHRKHVHHPHKHRKGRVHRNAVNNGNIPETTMLKNWNAYNDALDTDHHRSRRSTSGLSQWQNVLEALDYKEGNTPHSSDATKKLQVLEDITKQLEQDISSHGHHGHHHGSSDVDTKKEEIEVLKDLEETLRQHPDSQTERGGVDDDIMGQAHSHHHHRHESPVQGHDRLTSEEVDSHGHSRMHTELEVKPNIDKLEQMVLQDVANAEDKGLTTKEEVQLEKEIEGLELLEKQSIQDMIKNSGSNTDLNAVEGRVQLWVVLQQLIKKLKSASTNTKLSRAKRGAVDTEIRDILSPLKRSVSRLKSQQAHGHHHHTKTHSKRPTAHSSTELPSPASTTSDMTDEDIDIGRVNKDRCERCEPLIGEEVCGANGKTYFSLCHAVNCAGLRESDITAGRCVEKNECAHNKCSDREQCVPMLHGACLSMYSKDGLDRLPCRRYTCVSEGDCDSENIDRTEVCGENGKTYPSLCYLHKADVSLAYTGQCRPYHCRGQVCGRDGVTYKSSCHARARSIRVDYPGECFTEDQNSKLVNCATVREAGRCVELQCSSPVIPAGACCPVCGGAAIIQPDSPALSELVSSWEEVNHLYVAENFLRHLLTKDEASKCELTATLTNMGNFSVVLSSISHTDHKICKTAANNLVQAINRDKSTTSNAMLHPVALKAAFINPFNPMASVKGYLLRSQDKMMKQAASARDQASVQANEALIEADRRVKNKQYQNAMERELSKATSQFMQPPLIAWTLIFAIACIALLH